ncbi:MAG: hypothetical protein AAGF02_15190 [Actinomycetota bacterium]|mgnify:CR=1 FL=1
MTVPALLPAPDEVILDDGLKVRGGAYHATLVRRLRGWLDA